LKETRVRRIGPSHSHEDPKTKIAQHHGSNRQEPADELFALERSNSSGAGTLMPFRIFIVVHDRNWKIVRTNRSLADHLGLPPVALVGEAVSSLRQLAEGDGTLPCPFCLYTGLSKEEHIISSAEKIYLVSTSRTSGATEDDARTIHVLKDITDRREAERRYRELYDSIQEGFFSLRQTENFWM